LVEEGRRLAAIMFTDMVGYTSLGQRNESLSLALVEEQKKLVRPVLARHQGREVKTIGDAFLVEFPNAVDAVRCAYDIQRAVREFNLSLAPDRRIHLRIGVHVGEIVGLDGDISGDAVNVASRIEPLSEDGGVCVSRPVFDFVKGRVDIGLSSMGPKTLKNVTEPMEVYRMMMPWAEEPLGQKTDTDTNRIAVLPFANMSPDPNDEYFADGMTEELIDRLAQVKALKVIARTSVMSYKGEKKKASAIARELDVSSLVEGSVRKAANRVRVTVQLISAGSEEHLWSSHYDGTLDDIFAVQSEIAEKVAAELKVQLLKEEKLAIEKKATQDTIAYTYYLQGMQMLEKMEEAPLRNALSLFEQALARDPTFARAQAGIGLSYLWLGNWGHISFTEGIEKGKAAAKKALELDPDLAEAHYCLALSLSMSDENQESTREFKRSLELNPSLAIAYVDLADMSATLGDTTEMARAAEKAYQMDPLSPRSVGWMGLAYFYTGRGEEAMDHWKKTLHLDHFRVYRNMFDYYASKGDLEGAEMTVKEMERIGPTQPYTLLNRGYLAALKGDETTARDMIAKLDKGPAMASTLYAGYIYYAMGDMDKFVTYLSAAMDNHLLPFSTIRYNPLFKRAWMDPRVGDVFRKVGLDPELHG